MKLTTENKLGSFIAKLPPLASALVLNHNGTTVESWTVEQARLPGAAAAVLHAGNEHTEDLDTAARYDLEWRDAAGRVLASKLVLCEPPSEDDMLSPLSVGSTATLAHGLALSYKHQHAQLKMFVGALAPIFNGYKELLEGYRYENETLRARMLGMPAPESSGNESAELTQLKVAAYTKLMDLGPDVGRLGLAALARAAGMRMPGDEEDTPKKVAAE